MSSSFPGNFSFRRQPSHVDPNQEGSPETRTGGARNASQASTAATPSSSTLPEGLSRSQRPASHTPIRRRVSGAINVLRGTSSATAVGRTATSKADASTQTDHVRIVEVEDAVLKATARTRATVDMTAVRTNYLRGIEMLSKDLPPGAKPPVGCMVVKADGYGLKASAFAKVGASAGCRNFFVAELSEAIKLRKSLQADRPDLADAISINVLGGLDMDLPAEFYLENDVMPVLNSLAQVRKWNEIAKEKGEKLDCILQFDTGMSRTGIGHDDIQALMAEVDAGGLQHIAPQLAMSHLAKAGDAQPNPEDPKGGVREPGEMTKQQLARFDAIAADLTKRFPGIQQSLGASSTVFLGHDLHKDMVRMGATFHAQAPFEADTNPLQPTLTVTSKLGPYTHYPAGEKVGYDGTYTVPPGGATLATMPVGYRDLLPAGSLWNHQKEDGSVPKVRVRTADGKLHECPFAGKFSMDMASIDISRVPKEQLKEGLEVVLIDDQVTTDQFAAMFGLGASYIQTKIASDRVFISHVEQEPAGPEPKVEPSPWSKAGRQKRADATAAE
jgi:alanine racemase